MDSTDLARNLARSLILGPWSREFIRFTLARRFPPQLQSLAGSISAELTNILPFAYSPSVNVVAQALVLCEAFKKVMQYCRQHNIWPDPDLSPPVMAPITAFTRLDLPHIPTVNALAEWLFLPVDRLEYLADVNSRHEKHVDSAVNHYHFTLKLKKSGSLRLIEAPKANLKTIQRQILHGILDKVPVHASSFGFVKGRNCLKAASRHVGEQTVLCFDLKNFFPSIQSSRIFGLYRCIGYPYEVARLLTGLSTSSTPPKVLSRLDLLDRQMFRTQHLPQGSPASPALANLVAFTLDRRLSALAKSLAMNYSRYADDLCFSGDQDMVGTMLRAVPQIIDDEGFHLNKAKTRIMSRTSRQIVTGIVVNVDRRGFDRLKAIIHAYGNRSDERLNDSAFRISLLGKIAWVEKINPHRGQKLRELLATAIEHRA